MKPSIDELLERFSLTDAGDRVVKDYSGGMRRRLDLAVSLIATPPVLFLDEPTTGLDPRSRVELWDVLRGLVRDGTTLLLTTQYLEEADQLADHIVVIDHGRIIAQGTPLELKDQSGRGQPGRHGEPARPRSSRARPLIVRPRSARCTSTRDARQLTAPAEGLARHDARSRPGLRRQRHRPRRPRPAAAQPRRRLPQPHRPPGRGRAGESSHDEQITEAVR